MAIKFTLDAIREAANNSLHSNRNSVGLPVVLFILGSVLASSKVLAACFYRVSSAVRPLTKDGMDANVERTHFRASSDWRWSQ